MLRMGRRGRDRMVVGFTTTYASIAYHPHGEVESIQHYVIEFVSDLRKSRWFFPGKRQD